MFVLRIIICRSGSRKEIAHISTTQYDKIPFMTEALRFTEDKPFSLKLLWNSLMAPEGTLIFLESEGLKAARVVFTSTEFGLIGIKVFPKVTNGSRSFAFPATLKEFEWDCRGESNA